MENTKKSFLTTAEAKALGLPSVDEQIAAHNRRVNARVIVKTCATQNIRIALNQAAAMYPEVVEEYRAELRNREARQCPLI